MLEDFKKYVLGGSLTTVTGFLIVAAVIFVAKKLPNSVRFQQMETPDTAAVVLAEIRELQQAQLIH